jgi:hypothetical protein
VRLLADKLTTSKVIIWKLDMFELAQKGMENFVGLTDLPSELESDVLTSQFWYFDNFHIPIGYTAEPNLLPPNSQCEALSLFSDSEIGIVGVHFFNSPSSCQFRAVRLSLPLTSSMAPFIALSKFMRLKIASMDQLTLPRSSRRRMARANEPIPDIRIIQLRACESTQGMSAEGRKLRHRAIWSGGWWRLPEPLKHDSKISGGKKGDLVVWHRPHVRGPEGAPLLPPRESVYVVAR